MWKRLQNLNYAVSQGVRISQYLSQAAIGGVAFGRRPSPNFRFVFGELRQLLERDLHNINAGIYKMPSTLVPNPLSFTRDSINVVRDFFRVKDRRDRESVTEFSTEVPKSRYPKYYAQNFHHQTNGYLSEASAELYDHQVEIVFAGGADATRRQLLVPLFHILRDHAAEAAPAQLLDVACGTGRFLAAVKENYPELHVTGLDLSPWYLKKARENLRDAIGADFVEANAEAMPFKDAQFDVVSCVYLFHELPRLVRGKVVSEMARVLKPGAHLIFGDSIQLGDKPQFDKLLALFPQNYHEPYYTDYTKQDLPAVFAENGLTLQSVDTAFSTKIMVFKKNTLAD